VFDQMSIAASLNPDPMDMDEDSDDNGLVANFDPTNRLQVCWSLFMQLFLLY
jgi:hypothetical protein